MLDGKNPFSIPTKGNRFPVRRGDFARGSEGVIKDLSDEEEIRKGDIDDTQQNSC